ncbi:protein WVD2-like 7 isoform X2 [Olea europaea var. sylvestris]|uniref:protein WVD2-like 7 isoform X2 n=1 Tax=Olea europaea var. sylvestris TaxID=158386 RepID=UPI000C1CEA99|nr:protein WVD2-like 7 isoform X2 [Olea europaea var. sylvestris]
MAGEIEEPFRLNFQADTLHSGSISFGRFETETLCWERRSSFSHNKYLEEVEKYSKRGSVTEKKAYFEAHFRKRGLLGQRSSECQNGTEYQCSENIISENAGYDEQHKHKDGANCSAHFDQSSHGSVHDREHEIPESKSERGELATSFYELKVESASDTNSADFVTEHEKTEEANHAEFGKLLPTNSFSDAEIEQIVQEEGSSLDTRHMTTADIELHPINHVAEGRIASEIKHGKPRSSQVSVAHKKRSMISEAYKGSGTKPRVKVNDTPVRSKAEKKTSHAVTQNKCSMHQLPKYEVLPGSKAKVCPEIKSTKKESGIQKVSVSQPLSLKKTATTACQSANRLSQATRLTPGMRQSVSDFNSRSGECAERRKQYHMKLEGKAHARENEIDQLQAKFQEKERAEIKEMRRSLNFKASPMPSFYHRTGQESDSSKAVSSINETSTQRTKSSSSSFRISERSSSSSSKGTNQALSISKPLKSPFVSGATSCHSTVTSDSKPSSPASLEGETSNNHPIQAAENNTVGRMKQQEKEKHINIRSHKVPKGNKIYEGPKVDGKQKPKNGRHSCTSVYGSSRTGRLAVGVAT